MNSFTSQELPQHWMWSQLNEICEAIRGVTFDASEAQDSEYSKSIACLTTSACQHPPYLW